GVDTGFEPGSPSLPRGLYQSAVRTGGEVVLPPDAATERLTAGVTWVDSLMEMRAAAGGVLHSFEIENVELSRSMTRSPKDFTRPAIGPDETPVKSKDNS